MTVIWSLSELFSGVTQKAKLDPELERWRALLYWAAQTPHYWAQSGLLAQASVLNSVSAIRSHLRQVPTVALKDFLAKPRNFRSGYPRLVAPQPAWTFWDTPARIAVIHPWFRSEAPVRSFPVVDSLRSIAGKLERFEADVWVGTPTQLLRLSHMRVNGPRRALIPIQGPGMRALSEGERDWLWHRFHVPLYQQLRGFQGELLAAECDAQVGYHVNHAAAKWESRQQELIYTSLVDLRHPVLRLASGWQGDLETSRCTCGCLSARLFPYEEKGLVRTGRVELPRVAPLEPKSSASANSATFAQGQASMVTNRVRLA
jgi:hypothetical protein